MPTIAQTFIDALARLEAERDVDAIANLFADDAEISNPLVQHRDGGRQAAKTFWSQYRAAFGEIRSEFRAVKEVEGMAFLEWTSKGAMDGKPFEYGGVSVLESDGDRITAFRTYFDTRKLPAVHSKGGEQTGRVQISGQESAQANEGERDDLVQAQRDAAEQRAGGGYS
ncbi:nuclear transport factor 2 family protein [Neorhizobium sp. NPDC001467]|uniref:nuclear transport factor 2 family protein n=1 Tax=Neorhizobium sp. NPDC001467 TaxID=3390595 RepID=UPI003D019748